MNNKIKNILFFSFAILSLFTGSYSVAAEQPGQPHPAGQQQPDDAQPQENILKRGYSYNYGDPNAPKGNRKESLCREIDQKEEENAKLLKNFTELQQKLGLLESNLAESKDRAEKAQQEAAEKLRNDRLAAEKRYTEAMEAKDNEYTARMNTTNANHQAAIEAEWKKRISMQQDVRYQLMQGQMPENVTNAEARLYNAQAAKVEWENSWGKVGADAGLAVVDFGVGTAKLVVAPLLVKGLTPKVEEIMAERLGKTMYQERAEDINKNEKIMSDINKRILESKEKAQEEERAHAKEMLKIQHRSGLINQFAATCQGVNQTTDDCLKMGKMIDAMLLADIGKCYKESTGKDYTETKPTPKK